MWGGGERIFLGVEKLGRVEKRFEGLRMGKRVGVLTGGGRRLGRLGMGERGGGSVLRG